MVLSSSSSSKAASASSSSPASTCAELKSIYHDCFNRWYSEKFSKGQGDKEECVAEWDKYRACLAKHLEDKQLRSVLLGAGPSPHVADGDDSSTVDADKHAQ